MMCVNPDCASENILARGYCGACYHRLKKRGTLKRSYVINSGRCSIDGCGEKTLAKNLCVKHYQQAEHPLKQPWKNLRSRYPGEFPPSWDKFEAFLADVPPKPDDGASYQLRRRRGDQPWSATNMHWMAARRVAGEQSDRAAYAAQYSKEWGDERKYGVTPEMRAAMLEAQEGKCAVCRKPETVANPRHPDRQPRRLCIDHDHATGKPRGLLCVRCNSLIGRRGANDSIPILRAAIAYLEAHAVDAAPA